MNNSKMIEHPEPYPESNKRFPEVRHFVIKDVSWWDDNGCSCCEAQLIEAYNCDELLALGCGTSYSLKGVLDDILHNFVGIRKDLLYNMTCIQLGQLMKERGFTYELIEE